MRSLLGFRRSREQPVARLLQARDLPRARAQPRSSDAVREAPSRTRTVRARALCVATRLVITAAIINRARVRCRVTKASPIRRLTLGRLRLPHEERALAWPRPRGSASPWSTPSLGHRARNRMPGRTSRDCPRRDLVRGRRPRQPRTDLTVEPARLVESMAATQISIS